MRLLLDTHYAVWVAVLTDRLKPTERRLLEENDVAASAVSLWELRIKWSMRGRDGRPKGPVDPADVFTGLDRLGIETLPLTAHQACAVLDHPIERRDPFDVQLLLQAQELGAQLLTRDDRLRGHPLVWRG